MGPGTQNGVVMIPSRHSVDETVANIEKAPETPFMLAAPSIAIDLPMKILVAEGPDGQVRISYNAPEYLQARHHLPEELFRAFRGAGIDVLAAKAADESFSVL